MMYIAAIRTFLSSVPWQAYAAAAMISLCGLSYCKGKQVGKDIVYAKLEKAQDKAEAKAEKAATSADEKQVAKSEKFEAEQDALRKAIDNAKATDTNALDTLFD